MVATQKNEEKLKFKISIHMIFLVLSAAGSTNFDYLFGPFLFMAKQLVSFRDYFRWNKIALKKSLLKVWNGYPVMNWRHKLSLLKS